MVCRSPKYFSLQMCFKTDLVSIDQLKPFFSKFPVTAQEPPQGGKPMLSSKPPALVPPTQKPPAPVAQTLSLPTSLSTAKGSRKKVRFSPPVTLSSLVRRNPRRVVGG